jgi:hypothetical protein
MDSDGTERLGFPTVTIFFCWVPNTRVCLRAEVRTHPAAGFRIEVNPVSVGKPVSSTFSPALRHATCLETSEASLETGRQC